jgi:SAM-dependent methyltransferase
MGRIEGRPVQSRRGAHAERASASCRPGLSLVRLAAAGIARQTRMHNVKVFDMQPFQRKSDPRQQQELVVRRVLNAGSGPQSSRQLHPMFRTENWREVRLDIDPQTNPDMIGSITDMSGLVPSQSFDAVWSSHSLEHLHTHEVPLALAEFRRVLKPEGFALITSPDLESVASWMLEHGLDQVLYTSAAGPITPHDIFFGHSSSIALGKRFMAHKTGFTCALLGQRLLDAGFPIVLAKRERLDLWAMALMENVDKSKLQHQCKAAGLDMFDEVD